jgi:pyruvate/2-oxoglutarate dehydrogenase complex dihydrolipoamide acyltransferase (E2) component
MFVFELPEIGEGVVEGEIVQWLVKPGEVVAIDQPVCEIMTDKATVEISSPKAGTVVAVHGEPGDVIKVHTPLVDIDDGGAGAATPVSAPAPAPVAAPAPPVAAAPAPEVARPAAPVAPPPSKAPAADAPTSDPGTRSKTFATPAVRSHARSQDVDINAVPGSGPSGRVTRADIDAFVAQPAALKAPPAISVPSPGPSPAATAGDERIKIIGLRRKIAEKMVESYRRIPHFCYVDEVDATELVALRGELKGMAKDHGVKLTYLPFIMKALVVAFRKFPTVNSVMDEAENTLVVRKAVNIGIATDTPAGLYVPVIHNVQAKSILQLATEIRDVVERTQNGTATLEDFQGGTFTITSVGNIGGRFATPIINAPEVAILGVNQIHDRPMVIDGEIVARKMMYLSPSFDHRVIDGAVAARFVSEVKAVLESPKRLLLEA